MGKMTLFAALTLILLVALPGRARAADDDQPATVLLITSDKLKSEWIAFAAWKTTLGKPTKIVTVQAIASQYEGSDIQQKIRACVLEHIDKRGTKWVILGGDSQPGAAGHVPDRDTKHTTMRHDDIPTDLYYISAKSWDANGDGVYGEWAKDRDAISYTNTASIGRIPVRTAADVQAYTEKVIAYESRYPTDAFAQTMVYTCPEPVAYPKLNTSRKTLAATWTDGKLMQYFHNRTPWDGDTPGDHDLNPANWAKMINDKQAGKMHMHGHGFLPVWVLEKRQTVDKNTVAKLTNKDAYPVITTVSCFTGQYDDHKDPSITESMLRQPGGGAVVMVAPSRAGVPVFADRRDFRLMMTEGKMDGTTRLLTLFWKLGLEGDLTAGEAMQAAQIAMSQEAKAHTGYHWCLCELNLLGDPTLSLRSKNAVTPKVEHPATIKKGKRKIVVKTDQPGATVCLWCFKGGDEYEVTTADNNGIATFKINAEPSDDLNVTVSGPNLNAVSSTIKVK